MCPLSEVEKKKVEREAEMKEESEGEDQREGRQRGQSLLSGLPASQQHHSAAT